MNLTTPQENPWIWCDVCQKPVDKIQTKQNPMKKQTIFNVWCHGQEDTCIVDYQTLIKINPNSIKEFMANGVAFKKSRKFLIKDNEDEERNTRES